MERAQRGGKPTWQRHVASNDSGPVMSKAAFTELYGMPLRSLSAVRSQLACRKSRCCIARNLRLSLKPRGREGVIMRYCKVWGGTGVLSVLAAWVLYADRQVFGGWYSNALAAPLRVLLSSSDLASRVMLWFFLTKHIYVLSHGGEQNISSGWLNWPVLGH